MKRKVRFFAILGIIAVLFSVAAFAIPFKRNASFWVAYAAEIIAVALQYPIFQSAFGGITAKSKFYGMPTARIGYIYLGAQTVISLAVFALGFISGFPAWISVLLSSIVLALALLGVVGTDVARDQVQQLDAKKQTSSDMMVSLRLQAIALPSLVSDSKLKQQLVILADDLRFSDPVSSPQTAAIEKELFDILSILKEHIINGTATIDEVDAFRAKLSQRNVICKDAK